MAGHQTELATRGESRAALAYVPSLAPETFLLLTWRGDSCRLRDYRGERPAALSCRSMTDLRPLIGRLVDIPPGGRRGIEATDYWRERIRELNASLAPTGGA
jgi:hypothetical protein